ncbi:MAG: polyphosphate polymerase domain-containing protein [Bacteroidota bacterium]
MTIASEIEEILADYDAITLEEIERASLLRRKDRKYLFSTRLLPEILNQVSGTYRVLEINGSRSHPYRTFYYDTPDLEMYHKHHRGLANRHKVRFREYTSSDVRFLEVKRKNARGITNKKRIQTSGMDQTTLINEAEFLEKNSPYRSEGISFAMENGFKRTTLVSQSQAERITLDFQLRFTGHSEEVCMDLPGVCVAEIKYENHLSGSVFHKALRQSRISPRRFSKYAIGMALLHPELKQNRFKERVRSVHQINRK